MPAKKILAALEIEELRRGETDIEHAVGHCYKCGTVIEPLVKDQWFLSMKPLVAPAIEAIEAGEIRFVPENRGKLLIQYYKNIRDWNLSRQIPWGIPIPAFQSTANPEEWIFDDRVNEKEIIVNGTTYRREEDTFDTWFSSGQWPFITTDALDSQSELAKYYPASVMETGYDIIYQWVGRMIVLGLYRTGKVPFKDVYLHGMVNDEHNQK
jgi:valyl-tRNA synthetase